MTLIILETAPQLDGRLPDVFKLIGADCMLCSLLMVISAVGVRLMESTAATSRLHCGTPNAC
jgi:hypothetical protein